MYILSNVVFLVFMLVCMTSVRNNAYQLTITTAYMKLQCKTVVRSYQDKKKKKKKHFLFFNYRRRKGVVNKIMYFKITRVLLKQLNPGCLRRYCNIF